jgi:RNA polymerase sigma-70 factor (ECF subfamily)
MSRRLTYVIGAGVSLCGWVFAVQGEKAVSVKNMPPVVVKTVPTSGDTAVDATKVTEIRVTFSKEMMDKNWSWSEISAGSALPIKGDIKYDADGKTCIAPVKLEPGKTYVSWLNSEKFGNFKGKDGQSAVPYLLVFETKPAG